MLPKIRIQIDNCSLQMQSNKGRTMAIATMIASVLSKRRTPAIAWEPFLFLLISSIADYSGTSFHIH